MHKSRNEDWVHLRGAGVEGGRTRRHPIVIESSKHTLSQLVGGGERSQGGFAVFRRRRGFIKLQLILSSFLNRNLP